MRETLKMTLVPNSQLDGASWPHTVHSFHPVSVGLQKCGGTSVEGDLVFLG